MVTSEIPYNDTKHSGNSGESAVGNESICCQWNLVFMRSY